MNDNPIQPVQSEVFEDNPDLSVDDVCQVCRVSIEEIHIIVEEGIVEPVGRTVGHWRFRATSVQRIRSAVQLHQDLGINWAGAALALELLDELRELRARLRRLESHSRSKLIP